MWAWDFFANLELAVYLFLFYCLFLGGSLYFGTYCFHKAKKRIRVEAYCPRAQRSVARPLYLDDIAEISGNTAPATIKSNIQNYARDKFKEDINVPLNGDAQQNPERPSRVRKQTKRLQIQYPKRQKKKNKYCCTYNGCDFTASAKTKMDKHAKDHEPAAIPEHKYKCDKCSYRTNNQWLF